MRNKHKEVRHVQDLSEKDESRINEVVKNVNDNLEGIIHAQVDLQKQPRDSVVCWEKFLPRRSLKVLLVENDDSTRHLVSALLRNCSYEVTAVASGPQAWKILKDLTNDIDLILTEVVMPHVSGISLLCKIMSHKTCKNIPVIMMSAHDSMATVFQCLSKGAADFLVKPIRKNELKNLWQHVWRRCHSSSDSGSESGIHTQKYAKLKNVQDYDNTIGSNSGDNDGSNGFDVKDGSQSDIQSPWTKRAAELNRPKPMLSEDQSGDAPDSTCDQIIHPKPGAFDTATECQQHDERRLDGFTIGKDLETGVPIISDIQQEYLSEKISTKLTGTMLDKLPILEPDKDEQSEKGLLRLQSEKKAIDELRDQDDDLRVSIANSTNTQVETVVSAASNGLSKISEIKYKVGFDTKELMSHEPSLKRPRGSGDPGGYTHDGRSVLRRYDMSAISRYNPASTTDQATTGNIGSCYTLDNSSEAVKTESMNNFPSNSNITPNQHSNGSRNDMGSTTKNVFTKPASFNEKSASTSTDKGLHPHTCPPQQVIPKNTDDLAVKMALAQQRGSHQLVQVEHHHHHHHHYHHHHPYVHNTHQQQSPSDHADDVEKQQIQTKQQLF